MNLGSELEKIAHIYGGVHTDTKRKRRRRQKRLLSELMHDYAQNSTLHGLRYMVQRGLSVAERLFWFVTVVVSIVLCLMCIYDAYHKWATSPVIVTVNEKQSHVGKVPFPSVMICPAIKVVQTVYNFTEKMSLLLNDSLSNDEFAEFLHISAMCDDFNYYSDKTWTDKSYITDITKVALGQDKIFGMISWNLDNYLNETIFFKRVYTEEGVCYTANSLAATDIFENTTQREYLYMESDKPQVGWSLENGYNYSENKPYPLRGRVSSSTSNMELILIHNPDYQDKECNLLFSGYKIYLQHPADYPQSSMYYYAAIPEQVTSLAISFHELTSESSLSKYSPEIRQCYFPEDRKLRYFKIYTEKNCQAECLSNYTFAYCKCVNFYMPHDNSSQLCSITVDHSLCLEDANDLMIEKEKDAYTSLDIDLCRCLPACNSVQYDAEVLKTQFHLSEKLQKSYDFDKRYLGRTYSQVNLYFKRPQFVTMQRRELISKIDLLADIGGLLGLFLGFSFLSLVEIVYFLTLRVGYTLKRDLNEEKQNSNQTDKVMRRVNEIMNVGSELEKIASAYGSVCVTARNERRKRQKRLLSELVHDYAQNSTLHGLRYIVQRGLSIAEKLFWVITVVISFTLCSIYIYDAYHKYATSPVIVTVSERQSSVGTVPFPSVMICPEVKVSRLLYNYGEKKELYSDSNLTDEKLTEFVHISTMCDYNDDIEDYKEDFNDHWEDVSLVTDITKVALIQDDIFGSAAWNGHHRNYYKFLKKVYTQEGVCYTANSLAGTDIFENTTQREYPYMESDEPVVGWSLENGYDYTESHPYPMRGRVFGSTPDMQFILMHDPKHQDKACNQLYSGYRIYLQHPADYPQSSLYYYAAIPEQVTSLAISFHELTSESSLSKYSPEIRQCYFLEDRKLRYFKIYTEKNCQAECLSNYTFAYCKCVEFYMPHDNSSQLCSISFEKRKCVYDVKDLMANKERDASDAELKTDSQVCRCLPACNSVKYDAEVLKTQFHLDTKVEDQYNSYYNPENSYSLVNLYFKQPQFVTMQRRELISATDLLADIGGLLGLFLGFSFLSLVEIIYFFTLRVGYALKRDLNEEKAKEISNLAEAQNELTFVSVDKNK